MIAEGAFHTRSMPRYIGRLALFAILSEPVFYFAFDRSDPTIAGFLHSLSGLNLTNVFVTLSLGAIAIYVFQLLNCSQSKKGRFLFAPILFIILFAGGYFGCDYGMTGIVLIFVLFLSKKRSHKAVVIVIWSLVLYILGQAFTGIGFNWHQISAFSVFDCICAALSCALIWYYNGKRGKKPKWIFYIYYPVHLLILICIKAIIF